MPADANDLLLWCSDSPRPDALGDDVTACSAADLEATLADGVPPVVMVAAPDAEQLVERARSFSADVAVVVCSQAPPSDQLVTTYLAAGADNLIRTDELGAGPLEQRGWYRWALAHRCAQAGDTRATKNAAEVRERIVAVATHDLRTPLGVCEMAIELIAGAADPKQRGDLVARMRRALGRMRWLIDDLRDYAAIDAGSMRIERSPTSVASILDDVNSKVGELANKDRVNVDVVCELDQGQRAWVDRGRIVQALVSLMASSVKCTPGGGRVELGCELSADRVCFLVSDSGPAIPRAEQEHMFEQLTPLRSSRGVALGLALARGIAMAHGGTLEIASPLPGNGGEGARFTIRLPQDRAPARGSPDTRG